MLGTSGSRATGRALELPVRLLLETKCLFELFPEFPRESGRQVMHQTNNRVRPNDPFAGLSIYLVRVVLALDHVALWRKGNARIIEGTRSPLICCEDERGGESAAKLLSKDESFLVQQASLARRNTRTVLMRERALTGSHVH